MRVSHILGERTFSPNLMRLLRSVWATMSALCGPLNGIANAWNDEPHDSCLNVRA